MDAKTQPSQIAVNESRIFVLTGTTLKQGEIGQEFVTWRPIASSVSAFAVSGENVAVVKDGILQLGTFKGQEFQLSVLDDRKGEFGDLTLSRDGQWLAYTYRAKTSDQPQLWLAHVPTKRLWRIAVNATSPVFAGR
jgi:Tol biopolymer transport system component